MFRILSATFVLWLCLRGTALADVLYTIEELLPLPGFTTAHAYSLNDSGQVVGYSWTPVDWWPERGAIAPMLWDKGSALLLQPGASTASGWIPMDINNAGQIVGHGRNLGAEPLPLPDDITGAVLPPFSGGSGSLLWPDAGSWPIASPGKCAVDEWSFAITDSGYSQLITWGGSHGLVSPNMNGALCGLTILELYESGLALTTEGYVFDPIVDGVHQWVTVPDCTGATGIAAEVCALADGELHNKMMNESGQFILNVGNQAFLYTPCPPFPGGGSTEGCFPGPGGFPGLPEPATLALIGIGLAGLVFRRRNRVAQ